MKEFKEFVDSGVVKKQSPDKSRAISLIKESDKDYRFLLEILYGIVLIDFKKSKISTINFKSRFLVI